MTIDYLRYYHLERYLLEDVHRRFHEDGSIGAFDFFSIVVWKANRAKSKVAKVLLERDPERRTTLDPIAHDLTKALHLAPDSRTKLQLLLLQWGLRLPMASAILAVFWPDDFSVYDVRVCDELAQFHRIADLASFTAIWEGYSEYVEAVRNMEPRHLGLRDKDRYLWAKSRADQLDRDLVRAFA